MQRCQLVFFLRPQQRLPRLVVSTAPFQHPAHHPFQPLVAEMQKRTVDVVTGPKPATAYLLVVGPLPLPLQLLPDRHRQHAVLLLQRVKAPHIPHHIHRQRQQPGVVLAAVGKRLQQSLQHLALRPWLDAAAGLGQPQIHRDLLQQQRTRRAPVAQHLLVEHGLQNKERNVKSK